MFLKNTTFVSLRPPTHGLGCIAYVITSINLGRFNHKWVLFLDFPLVCTTSPEVVVFWFPSCKYFFNLCKKKHKKNSINLIFNDINSFIMYCTSISYKLRCINTEINYMHLFTQKTWLHIDSCRSSNALSYGFWMFLEPLYLFSLCCGCLVVYVWRWFWFV